jgi:hypothetical protein
MQFRLMVAFVIASGASWGCSADAPIPPANDAGSGADAAPATDARAIDAPRESPVDVVPDQGVDLAPPPDAPVVPSALPLPTGVAPPIRILAASATLLGDRLTTCTHQDPPSSNGDRWCAFAVAAPTGAGTELWVMDVTAASSGAVPPCDGTSPACLRLTTNLWTANPIVGPGYPVSNAFNGDTLVFYADSTSTSAELHRGPVSVWRPGWSKPRPIATGKGFLCEAHPRAPVAYCLEDVVGDPDKPDSFELRAGAIGEETGDVLPSLGRLRPFRADGRVAWQAGFSRAGDVFAFSSPDPDPAVESLHVVATSALGLEPPREALRDLTSWVIANDGSKIYFVRPVGATSRDLYAAAFPSGGEPTLVTTNIDNYFVVGTGATDRGVAYLTPINPANHIFFQLVPDTSMPARVLSIFTGDDMFEDFSISPDGRYTAWRNGTLLARIVRNQDQSSCLVNTTEELAATAPHFLASAGLVVWTEQGPDNQNRQDGFVATAACEAKQRFALGLPEAPLLIGDRGLVFGDEATDDPPTMTLNYAGATHTAETWALDRPVRITDGVSTGVVPVGAAPLLLVFRKQYGDEQTRGSYLFGPVPF